MENTIPGALLFGIFTSLHCVGMCGPLACGLSTLAKSEGERLAAASLYHGSRLFAYGTIGAICGAIGQQPLKWFFSSPAVVLPWMLVLALLVIACGLDKKIPYPAMLKRFTTRARFRTWSLRQCCSDGTADPLASLYAPLPHVRRHPAGRIFH